MKYSTIIMDKRGIPEWITENLLDFFPKDLIYTMEVIFVSDQLKLCGLCPLDTKAHVIIDGAKLCPVLFTEVFPVDWKIEDLA